MPTDSLTTPQHELAETLLPATDLQPQSIDEVLALPSFSSVLRAAERRERTPFAALAAEWQDAIVERRLRQLVAICRLNPVWRQRIDAALPAGEWDGIEAFQAIPITDKETFREMFTDKRPGMVVPIERGGFEIVASGGTSSGLPSETVYPLDELQETYAWAGEFIGRHLIPRFMPEAGPKWVATTLADYQMWSSGTMVGGVLQKIPGVNYVGAGPMSREVFQWMMNYPGPKAIMGITQSVALLPKFAAGLSPAARASFRIAMYGSGLLTPKAREELATEYPNVQVLSYFAATQAETIGLQLDARSPILTAVPGLHLIEIVDEEGRAVPEGAEGELVVTRLFGHAAPCLRYKVGDRVIRRSNFASGGLNARQFEYVGRSGDFMHIGDTQYSAQRAIEAAMAEFKSRQLLDIAAVASDYQFVIDRAARELHLVVATPAAAGLHAALAARLGPEGTAPVLVAALIKSLSVFNSLEANEASLWRSGYTFGLKIVEPHSPVLHRTAVGKVPLVYDKPAIAPGLANGHASSASGGGAAHHR